MLTVTKEVTFDCAHLLTGHEGLCKNLHGHTYKLQVTVARKMLITPLDPPVITNGPAEGMVIDFKQLNEILRKEVTGVLDHAFIYWKEGGTTERRIANLLQAEGMRVVAMSQRPTAENMAMKINHILREHCKELSLDVISVKLWETPTSFAEVVNDVNEQ